jgi:hypothetical protein
MIRGLAVLRQGKKADLVRATRWDSRNAEGRDDVALLVRRGQRRDQGPRGTTMTYAVRAVAALCAIADGKSILARTLQIQLGGSFAQLPPAPATLCYLRVSAATAMGLLSVAPGRLSDQGREWPPSTSYRHPYSRSTTYLIAA